MYDVIVIGSGPGGYVAAIKGAHMGGKIAVVEGRDVGGTCLNRGCIPTKALVRTAEVYTTTKRAAEFGVGTGEVTFDLKVAMARKRRVVEQLTGGVVQLFKSNGIDLYRGYADIVNPTTVSVAKPDGTTELLEGKNIIIATGSKQEVPPIPKESLDLTISSDDALELEQVPKTMVAIGGGVLAVEFSCIYNAFGTKVDMIKRSPVILPAADEEIARRLMPILKRRGISVNSGMYIKEIVETDDGERLVRCDTKDGGKAEFKAEKILVAMGMVPNFGGISLDKLGITHDRKRGIQVDDYLKTSVPNIYAIGDVLGRYYLAYVASFEGICAIENIFGHQKKMDYSVVPGCVFSSPEVADVGMTEKQVKEAGIPYKVSKFPFTANGRAVAMGETEGIVKIIADPDGKVLGMHILGPHADDLIHEGAMAIKMGSNAKDIAEMMHAHPCLSEMVMEAAEGIVGQPIHLARMR